MTNNYVSQICDICPLRVKRQDAKDTQANKCLGLFSKKYRPYINIYYIKMHENQQGHYQTSGYTLTYKLNYEETTAL